MAPTRISGSVAEIAIERSRRSEARGETKKVSSEKASSADQLSISDNAAVFQQAEAIAASAPDVDMDRVNEIKQAIVNGELKIDYEKLAQKMLDFEAELGDIPFGDE